MEQTPEQLSHCLWALAEESLNNSFIHDAILCLEAVIQNLRVFPHTEVRTKLRLVDLYLRYTEHWSKAKEHLDSIVSRHITSSDMLDSFNKGGRLFAQKRIFNIQLPATMRLHVIYFQSIIYERSGQAKSLKQVLQRGTEFCENHTEFPDWYHFFLLEQARALAQEQNGDGAIELLQKGLASAEKKSSNVTVQLLELISITPQVLFQLALAQQYASKSDHIKVSMIKCISKP